MSRLAVVEHMEFLQDTKCHVKGADVYVCESGVLEHGERY